ncbi:hydroxymethylglutaryl-CoA synthase [Catenulispora sp. MAP12-49]|uniref:OB-fold domain-containing protein n=1 Tax=Catenulispora sp. MAP12-49 TaxID=3156302 RepID=UPI0035174277
MRGILGWGAHLPYRRLDRTGIAAVAGTGGGTGTRAVACYDEDTTTMGVAAARAAVPPTAAESIRTLWFTTTAPAYEDRTNATAVHAALRLPRTTAAYDATGAVRCTVAALDAALTGAGTHLVVASDLRTGRPGSADEAAGGDAAAALLVGEGDEAAARPVLAELLAHTSASEEFLDRWRTPGEQTSKTWEDRFGETHYVNLATEAWNALLAAAGTAAADIDILLIAGTHERAAKSAAKKTGVPADRHHDPFAKTVGNSGAAHPALLLASALENARSGQRIALLVLADGADAFLWRATEALSGYRPARPVAEQIARAGSVPYGRYLAWRGFLPVEPPRRPEPARTSASAAARAADWKFALVGSAAEDGTTHLPPSPFDSTPHPAAGAEGTIVTFTVDRLAYSPSPPVVFAVVDFDGGGRLPIELTDVDAGEVAIGLRVEATFRRLSSADGIHNYFWKARPVRRLEELEEPERLEAPEQEGR